MRITAGNNLLFISPWLPCLEKILTVFRRVREVDGTYNTYPEKLYMLQDVNNVPSGYAPIGLGPRIFDLLKRNNISYTFVDNRPPLPIPDFNLIDVHGLRDGQDTALVRIAESHMGTIVAATGYGKSHMIVQIAKMYPDQNIVITTATKSVVKTIYERLIKEPALTGQIGTISSLKNTGPNYRVVVSTIKSLFKTNREKCNILIADESHDFGAPTAADEIARFPQARRFGFSASPTGRSDNADLVTEALFGPPIFDFSYQDSVDTGAVVPIDAHIYTISKGLSKEYKDATAVNRHGIWRNPWRNEKIAEVARLHKDKQVLILCDTIDHVMHLKRRLPEAAVAYSNCSKDRYQREYVDKGFTTDPYLRSKDIDQVQADMESGKIRLCIATMIFKQGVDFEQLGVLIRGDGKSGEIPSTQLPGRVSRTFDGKEKGILVDFLDVFDKRLKNRSVKRISFYKKKGWDVKYDNKV
jgi:superfamily II DNA or RNA helicase